MRDRLLLAVSWMRSCSLKSGGHVLKVTELVRSGLRISRHLCSKKEQVWGREGGGFFFPEPETAGSTASTTNFQRSLLSPRPVPLLAPKPWDSFPGPRRAPALTSVVTPPPSCGEEGDGIRSQGMEGEEIPSPAGFLHIMQICLNGN